jgi:hypothetical protein
MHLITNAPSCAAPALEVAELKAIAVDVAEAIFVPIIKALEEVSSAFWMLQDGMSEKTPDAGLRE